MLLELDKCRETLEFAKLPDNKKAAVIKDISALNSEVVRLQSKQKEETSEQTKEVVQETFDGNKDLPGARSDLKLEVSNDKIRGRYLTATKDIELGNYRRLRRFQNQFKKYLQDLFFIFPLFLAY